MNELRRRQQEALKELRKPKYIIDANNKPLGRSVSRAEINRNTDWKKK